METVEEVAVEEPMARSCGWVQCRPEKPRKQRRYSCCCAHMPCLPTRYQYRRSSSSKLESSSCIQYLPEAINGPLFYAERS
jgi:hypothetical protein